VDALHAALRSFEPPTATEAADLDRVRGLADPWSRATPLHVTGSAVVVDPARRRVLLRWHERQQAWLQVGGHADPGETDPYEVALREAAEETGLPDLSPWPDDEPRLVHLVIVPVPAKGDEPAHEHADLRYLLATDRPHEARAESEAAPLRWLGIDEALAFVTEDNLRATLARAAALLD
jgi:8-oxo-dGTP pyrophosphatase MutT (NUDIX family)